MTVTHQFEWWWKEIFLQSNWTMLNHLHEVNPLKYQNHQGDEIFRSSRLILFLGMRDILSRRAQKSSEKEKTLTRLTRDAGVSLL